ncbi:MAG: hypothetical protein ACRDTN_19570 [Mycobacterium sp.]
MPRQNIETAKRGYAAFTAGDLAALGIFNDSAAWTLTGEGMISGTQRGKGELTELVTVG